VRRTGETRPGCAIGVDVGGTKIACGLLRSSSGEVLAGRAIPTRPERGGEAVLSDVLEMARESKAEAERLGLRTLGVGVGVPELVDAEGNLTSENAIPWLGVPVAARLTEVAPAVVESDVRAAALAEATFGAGEPFGTFVYVSVGTGISSCLVQEGRPYRGARGNALVLASAPTTSTCPRCGNVFDSVLEDFASGPALVARYNERGRGSVARAEEVVAAARDGDAPAAEVVESAGEALGSSVGFLINVLDPEAVVVGGGLGTAGGLYWESLLRSARRRVWSDASREVAFLPAGLGPDAGMAGAALTALRAFG
jgi:glucokinase